MAGNKYVDMHVSSPWVKTMHALAYTPENNACTGLHARKQCMHWPTRQKTMHALAYTPENNACTGLHARKQCMHWPTRQKTMHALAYTPENNSK